jgi:hypothetical protein
MKEQKKLIREKNWDNLIILDACRYDCFEENYEDFLEGELENVESPVDTRKSFATTDWCKQTFEDGIFDEVLYFSSTPRVNSRVSVDGFKASDYFSEIINLWEQEWNPEIGTVLPEDINKSVERRLNIYPAEKTIIHYLQPHCPYITADKPQNVKTNSPEARKNLKNRLMVMVGPKARSLLGPIRFRKLTDKLGFPPVDHLQEILRSDSPDKVRQLYTENLRAALEEVAKLEKELEGNTIVTADHGEYLGEKGYFGHSFVPTEKPVKEVPWFEVKDSKDV